MTFDCSKLWLSVERNGTWQDVKGDFTSISLGRSLGVEKGLLFRPEAADMSCTTRSIEYAEGIFGKRVRLAYGDEDLHPEVNYFRDPAGQTKGDNYVYLTNLFTYPNLDHPDLTAVRSTISRSGSGDSRQLTLTLTEATGAGNVRVNATHVSTRFNVEPGATYTISAESMSAFALQANIRAYFFATPSDTADTGSVAGTAFGGTSSWANGSLTFTVPAGITSVGFWFFMASAGAVGNTLAFRRVILTKTAVPVPYFSGYTSNNTFNTYAWTGTTNRSASTRVVNRSSVWSDTSVVRSDGVQIDGPSSSEPFRCNVGDDVYVSVSVAPHPGATSFSLGIKDTTMGGTALKPGAETMSAPEVITSAKTVSVSRKVTTDGFRLHVTGNVVITKVMLGINREPSEMFTGSTSDDATYAYEWTGQPHASTSRKVHRDTPKVLFTGTITGSRVASVPGDDGPEYRLTIEATDTTDALAKEVLTGYTRPAETAGDRLRALGRSNMRVIDANRPMAALLDPDNPQVMEVMQDAADAQLARFYVDAENFVVVDANAADSPVVAFSDQHDTEHVCYRSLDMGEDLANSISGVVVTAKQDNTITVSRMADVQHVLNHERYELDLPYATDADLSAWAAGFPLHGYTQLEPVRLDTYFQESLLNVELASLVSILQDGRLFESGVKGISHSITPSKWDVSYDLMPGHMLRYETITKPSAVESLSFTSTSNSITLTWNEPMEASSLDRYMVRCSTGGTPPTLTTGTLLYEGTNKTATLGSLDSNATYSFSVWPLTTAPGVQGDVRSLTAKTAEIVPSAVTGFTATAASYKKVDLTWTAPAIMGDIKDYWISDGTNVTYASSSATSASRVTVGGRSYTFTIRPRTVNNTLGPATTATVTTPVGIVSKTWSGYATWHQSYWGNNNKASSFYQQSCIFGYYNSETGNSKSLIGFNVPAEVKNCVEITSIKFRYTVDHAYYGAGVDVRLGTHTNNSAPTTFSGAATAQETYFSAPESTVTRTITSWAADNFMSGAKGISVGPGQSSSVSYYGYLYGSGAATALRPWLEIKYKVEAS